MKLSLMGHFIIASGLFTGAVAVSQFPDNIFMRGFLLGISLFLISSMTYTVGQANGVATTIQALNKEFEMAAKDYADRAGGSVDKGSTLETNEKADPNLPKA